MTGFRPNRSEKGPWNTVPMAFPKKIAEIETDTRFVVVLSPFAILGIDGMNISCPTGPNIESIPSSMTVIKTCLLLNSVKSFFSSKFGRRS